MCKGITSALDSCACKYGLVCILLTAYRLLALCADFYTFLLFPCISDFNRATKSL